MADDTRRLRLPRLEKAELRDFSLFSLKPRIEVEFGDGVFCLAGANGLGKSSFIAAINYALTGIVPDPHCNFNSVAEYYRNCLKFTSKFFEGRIDENKRKSAEIYVELTLPPYRICITRGFFEQTQLRDVSIVDRSKDDQQVVIAPSGVAGEELHHRYGEWLTEQVGLDSFYQYAFLQNFVLSFDERRKLLFWDRRVLEQTLYLAFGVDSKQAKHAGDLRRHIEQSDSRVRNHQWDATKLRKRIDDLKKASEDYGASVEAASNIFARHEELTRESEESSENFDKTQAELRDAELKLADHAAHQMALRSEYRREFDKRVEQDSNVRGHPLIVALIENSSCELCGGKGKDVVRRVKNNLDSGTCPLCGSPVSPKKPSRSSMERLKLIDEGLQTVGKEMSLLVSKIERLREDFEVARKTAHEKRKLLEDFERENEVVHLRDDNQATGEVGLLRMIASLEKEREKILAAKEDEYAKREECRKQLQKLERQLQKQYAVAEQEFVPLFKNLAGKFLGLELDIQMDSSASFGLELVLEIGGSRRREGFQLSESQRFFVDIALRMALADLICDPECKTGLIIDTPEGSLDIAYETRAGEMFASFVEKGHAIMMTANINTSHLLLALAHRCGRKHMRLSKMTTWTELSQVQKDEAGLFRSAYSHIEEALGTRAKSHHDA